MASQKPDRKIPSSSRRNRDSDWETTRELLQRVKGGDEEALNRLYTRYRPLLHRWASRRLPQWARDGKDTDDLVQEALTKTLGRIDAFELKYEGALHAYLRRAVANEIHDLKEQAVRRPTPVELPSDRVDPSPSPLQETMGHEAYERYEAALERMPLEKRAAIILKIEMGFSYPQIAQALDKPTANAARMTVSRALVDLAKEMGYGR